MVSLNELLTYLNKYAAMRCFSIKKKTKKVTFKMLKDEVIGSRLLGELSGAEKILQAIVDNKDWDRDMIEAELHTFIVELNNLACEYLKLNTLVGVEDILREYGYYEKDNV